MAKSVEDDRVHPNSKTQQAQTLTPAHVCLCWDSYRRAPCRSLQEISRGVVLSRPGALAQPWHRDSGHLFEDVELPAHAITVFAPLVKITSKMGRTSFLPGSHRDGERVHYATDAAPNLAVTPALPLGSWLAFDSRIIHRGEANLDEQKDRPMLYFVYGKPWFQDVNNFPSDKPLFRDALSS